MAAEYVPIDPEHLPVLALGEEAPISMPCTSEGLGHAYASVFRIKTDTNSRIDYDRISSAASSKREVRVRAILRQIFLIVQAHFFEYLCRDENAAAMGFRRGIRVWGHGVDGPATFIKTAI